MTLTLGSVEDEVILFPFHCHECTWPHTELLSPPYQVQRWVIIYKVRPICIVMSLELLWLIATSTVILIFSNRFGVLVYQLTFASLLKVILYIDCEWCDEACSMKSMIPTSPSAPTWSSSITSYCWKGPRQYVEGMQRVSVHWQSEGGWIAAGGVVCVGCFLTWVIWDSSRATILVWLCNLIIFAISIYRLSSPMVILNISDDKTNWYFAIHMNILQIIRPKIPTW